MRKYQRFFLYAACALFIVLNVAAVAKQQKAIDFAAFYWAGCCAATGQTNLLYDHAAMETAMKSLPGFSEVRVVNYIYPPFFAYLAAPLAFLPYLPAMKIWLLSQLLLFIVAVFFFSRWVFGADDAERTLVSLLIALGTGVFFYNTEVGQSNVLVLALTALAVVCSTGVRCHLIGGVMWGLVLPLKPLLACLALCWWRKPRIVAGAVAALLSVGLAGFSHLNAYLAALPGVVAANYRPPPWNTSILGALSDFTTNPFPLYFPIVVLGLIITAFYVSKVRDRRYQAALAISAGLCFFPIVEVHHLLLAAIPILILVNVAAAIPEAGLRIGMIFVIASFSVTPYLVTTKPFTLLPLAGSIVLWFTLLRYACAVGNLTPRALARVDKPAVSKITGVPVA